MARIGLGVGEYLGRSPAAKTGRVKEAHLLASQPSWRTPLLSRDSMVTIFDIGAAPVHAHSLFNSVSTSASAARPTGDDRPKSRTGSS